MSNSNDTNKQNLKLNLVKVTQKSNHILEQEEYMLPIDDKLNEINFS